MTKDLLGNWDIESIHAKYHLRGAI
jgi:hypothetical protein